MTYKIWGCVWSFWNINIRNMWLLKHQKSLQFWLGKTRSVFLSLKDIWIQSEASTVTYFCGKDYRRTFSLPSTPSNFCGVNFVSYVGERIFLSSLSASVCFEQSTKLILITARDRLYWLNDSSLDRRINVNCWCVLVMFSVSTSMFDLGSVCNVLLVRLMVTPAERWDNKAQKSDSQDLKEKTKWTKLRCWDTSRQKEAVRKRRDW